MTTLVMLDTGPLGRIIHPRRNQEIVEWFGGLVRAGIEVILPEIADYEVRRNLLLEELTLSVWRLDRLKEVLLYLPLNTEAMLKAAELWAETRRQGYPTAPPQALDGDVILAAQASQLGAVIATENVRHLSRLADARHWREIGP